LREFCGAQYYRMAPLKTDIREKRRGRSGQDSPAGRRARPRRHAAAAEGRFSSARSGHETWFYFYLTAAIFISLIIYVTMRDTKKDSAMERHV
jgi:hypothetical protein